MDTNDLVKHGLKITPQRIAVLDAMEAIDGHPTAENIIDFIRRNHPNIAVGTVYKTLETFIDKGLIIKVKTDKDVMRYEIVAQNHHHLYCAESERIEDFYDDEINALLSNYFAKKKIPNFTIEEIKLQITGKFDDKPKK
ncbi:MAG: transcriptional repressor [Bacteroidales bacterium]|jgi:Fur family peroxide stress response transcriptional regulator|nr:transcriptional repressor [Bacteroidales bacterium]MDD4383752.1 transcriptional repressor [Bacteroidales bacterium]MDY0198445.1 transcriptional repressor [Tenuifilaceae bacterium]